MRLRLEGCLRLSCELYMCYGMLLLSHLPDLHMNKHTHTHTHTHTHPTHTLIYT